MRMVKSIGILFSCCILGCVSGESPQDESSQEIDSPGVTPLVVDDSFEVPTTDGCGRADYVDFGPGDPSNPANNDDYIVIHDLCSDGHGVIAFATILRAGVTLDLGSKYNGNGFAGAPVIWDPFPSGNVAPGDAIELTACLIDAHGKPFRCQTFAGFSTDG